MSDALEIRRNNIRAGAFTVTSLAVGFAILITLNSSAMSYLFGSFNTYTLVFSLEDGVEGLSPGAEVRVGGIPSGQVKTIRIAGLDTSDTANAFPHIEVDIEIDRRINLWSNAVAIRTPPVLGTNAWINISTVGGPDQTTLFRALRGLASRPWRRATPRGAEKNEVGLPPTLFATPSPRLGEQVSKARSLRRVQAHSTRKHSALARRGSSHTARAARAQQTHKGSLSQQGERRYRTRAAAPHTAENAARR